MQLVSNKNKIKNTLHRDSVIFPLPYPSWPLCHISLQNVDKSEVTATLMQFSDLHSEEEMWPCTVLVKPAQGGPDFPAGLRARLLIMIYTTLCGHLYRSEAKCPAYHWPLTCESVVMLGPQDSSQLLSQTFCTSCAWLSADSQAFPRTLECHNKVTQLLPLQSRSGTQTKALLKASHSDPEPDAQMCLSQCLVLNSSFSLLCFPLSSSKKIHSFISQCHLFLSIRDATTKLPETS